MHEYLTICGQRVYEGAIVTISGYPDTKWILCTGWYTYQGTNYVGWYFKAIPSGAILRATPDVLENVTVIGGVPIVPEPGPDEPYITQGATDTIEMNFSDDVDLNLVSKLRFTLKQETVTLTKETPDTSIEIDHNVVTVHLTQEDTLQLDTGVADLQLNWLYGDGQRGNSNIVGVFVYPNLVDEVIT